MATLGASFWQGVLPTLGRLLEVASAEPLPLCACLGMEGEQICPQASGLGAQRLALKQCGEGETARGEEAHNALGGRLLVGHALSSPYHRRIQDAR